MADLLAMKLGQPVFSWVSSDIVPAGELRGAYINALRSADKGDIQPLLRFARS
jgi:hypothetical protein